MTTPLRQTSLLPAHQSAKARMVDFAGWDMPVLYTSILDEARAVRKTAGMFDISHMGRIRILGSGASDLLQMVTTNNVGALQNTCAQYSLLTNPNGGVIDDIIVYRELDSQFLVVINASNTSKDIEWLRDHLPSTVSLTDHTDETAMIAVQGPEAPTLVADLAGMPDLADLKRFQYAQGVIAGAQATFCRTGYTGEDGFELILPAERAPDIWSALMEKGVVPCGLGARDALRIEAGYPLYGHEIDDSTTPVEAGLMWAVDLEKGNFIGRDRINQVKRQGASRRLMGLTSPDRNVPRQGYTIFRGEETVGVVTSGVFSPTRNHGIAMGYIAVEAARIGTVVDIAVRDRRVSATVVPKKALLQS